MAVGGVLRAGRKLERGLFCRLGCWPMVGAFRNMWCLRPFWFATSGRLATGLLKYCSRWYVLDGVEYTEITRLRPWRESWSRVLHAQVYRDLRLSVTWKEKLPLRVVGGMHVHYVIQFFCAES